MIFSMKPRGCDPAHIKGMSERLIVIREQLRRHGEATQRDPIEQLAELDRASAPAFVLDGLKREQLIAMNFDGPEGLTPRSKLSCRRSVGETPNRRFKQLEETRFQTGDAPVTQENVMRNLFFAATSGLL